MADLAQGLVTQPEAAASGPAPAPVPTASITSNGKRPYPENGSSPTRPDGDGSVDQQPQNSSGSGDKPFAKHNNKRQRPKKKLKGGRRRKTVTDGSAEEVLLADVQDLMKALRIQVQAVDESEETEQVEEKKDARPTGRDDDDDAAEADAHSDLPAPGSEIEMEVIELSSTGEGLAIEHVAAPETLSARRRCRIYVLSFAVPGDIVRARVFRHLPEPRRRAHEADDDDDKWEADLPTYSVADFLELVRPSPELRDDAAGETTAAGGGSGGRARCAYFGRCAGCQYQMLDYGEQLRIKRRVVERAYRHFSQLPLERVPAVRDTVASPLQYGYRTKLTPHFDGPPGTRRKKNTNTRADGLPRTLAAVPAIGFMAKAGRHGAARTIDIEQCPIGTPAVAAGLARERTRVAHDYASYQRGATILLRESTERVKASEAANDSDMDADTICVPADDGAVDRKTCITDNNATATEYVGEYVFTNPAGSFFQNNNSILPALTSYVREAVLQSPSKTPLRYLIDAYCGSGLFTIALAATLPGGSVGIDIAAQSIAYARRNAALNRLPADRCRFLAADAAQLFAGVAGHLADFRAAETAVVLDPPRKGCDAAFLRQLLAFAPARIVYVSCNVHTQARDVGMLVRGEVDWAEGRRPPPDTPTTTTTAAPAARYEIESIRGFDFFPQTAHVEGIAVLHRADLL